MTLMLYPLIEDVQAHGKYTKKTIVFCKSYTDFVGVSATLVSELHNRNSLWNHWMVANSQSVRCIQHQLQKMSKMQYYNHLLILKAMFALWLLRFHSAWDWTHLTYDNPSTWDLQTPSRPMFRKLVDVNKMDRTPLFFIIVIKMYLKQVVIHPLQKLIVRRIV